MKALLYGTILCGGTAAVVTKGTMWALDVHNIKEFNQRMDQMFGKKKSLPSVNTAKDKDSNL